MIPSAKIQERALAQALEQSLKFREYFLSFTKFAGLPTAPVLIRSDNPWYTSSRTGRQSETDVLAVFSVPPTDLRFAIHVENKRVGDRFQPEQPELYQERAKDWVMVDKWGSYSDFECILIATEDFIEKHAVEVAKFDVAIPSEEISEYLPEFGQMGKSK